MSISRSRSILVKEVMLTPEAFPVVSSRALFQEALEAMEGSGLGIVCIVNDRHSLMGIITDGDIRRKLLRIQKPFSALFVDDALRHAKKQPSTVVPESGLEESIELMGEKKIWDLPVVNADGKLVGLLHLHPAIKAIWVLDE